MKAIVQTEYGSPDVLRLAEVAKPLVAADQVLVRVHAASVNAGDWHLMRGTPFLIRLMFGGLRKPKIPILGSDMAGEVAVVGAAVSQFQPGDAVFGDLSESGFGAFGEYVAVPETALAPKPSSLSFAQAATVPVAAITALQALRDCGQLQPGQLQPGQLQPGQSQPGQSQPSKKVLINGASGGVGSFAVQIAKAWGAEVTAVCRQEKMAMVRSLGADQVVDYGQTDVTQTGQQYDLILDAAAFRSVLDYGSILKSKGTYVLIGGSTARFFQVMLLGFGIGKLMDCQVTSVAAKPNQQDLQILADLLAQGLVRPFVDRQYPLAQVPTAIEHLEQRRVQGKIAINLV
jgi:NADPH:quinone reductase-like Zn-dependent oxidoreductase